MTEKPDNRLPNFRKWGPGRKHRYGKGRVKRTKGPSLLSQMLQRQRDGQRPMPTGGKKAKAYRGRRRNEFFGRLPIGNTNPDNRFSVRP